MTPQAALTELLGRVGARLGESVTVSTEELNQWPTVAVAALKSQGLLLKARPAKSVDCPGCEQECNMPVHTVARANAPAASFVVCDKRSDINRVAIPAARLALWRCDAKAVCGFVAASLGLQQTTVQQSEGRLLPIGMARGNKRTQMLCLRVQGQLALVVGADAIPLADVVAFENGSFTLNHAVIRQTVDAATTADSRHTPSTAKREARKIDTQAMYVAWQKAYRALLKKSPGKSDVWYSQQIAKTTIAQGRDASTIKKNMIS
ncbi:MAG: hypothetical protein H0W47_16065 [Polaromonas sp.]|uniref:hypothetical protein n=1 Tax=Polaromonas sp. TaxID=1869339 RepID=UPI001822D170|nr:hypothetical protein [Polaromonas sp.]MBA3595285.1 hypothetical protein [Polaromonas sp.]